MGGSLAQSGLPQPLPSASYDAGNELTQWDATNLTYDLNGNLTGDGVNTYTWNARNQLTTVKDTGTGTTLANFQYDAFGRRTENAAGDGMLYDGVNAVQELSGTTPVVNRLTGGVDEFFGRTDSGGTTFPLTDALGSTIALTDSSGTIQTQYTYEPFGATTPTGATSANWYQFTGRANDGTGLYYYRARYYSPRFQRFVSEDPAGIAGGVNFYAYASDSPVDFRDPFGLKPNGCQAFYCSPVFWQGVGFAALAVAAPEALPLEWAPEVEAVATDSEAFSAIGSTGRIGEQWLADNLGGESQVYYNTSQGARYVDQVANGVANESKVGYQSLTQAIQQQIGKDVELMQSGAVDSVNWHFFTSPVTGLGGPSEPLWNALINNGINVIIH